MNQQSIDAVFDERDQLRTELEQVKAERDELRQTLADMEPVKTQAEIDFALAEQLRLNK